MGGEFFGVLPRNALWGVVELHVLMEDCAAREEGSGGLRFGVPPQVHFKWVDRAGEFDIGVMFSPVGEVRIILCGTSWAVIP